MSKPKPNAEGKIPCIACDHNGRRKNMISKQKRICEYCNGTKMRAAPIGYTWEEPKVADWYPQELTDIEKLEQRIERLEALHSEGNTSIYEEYHT